MSSSSTPMHRSAARSSLTAHRPMALTALRTKSTSTSVLYSFSSSSTCSMFRSDTSLMMISSFSSLT
jgi:hypothetical protein